MSDILSGYTFVDGEKGVTATKLNSQLSGAVIQTDFFANKPAGTALNPTDQLLELTSGGTYARITGAQLSNSVAGQLTLANTSASGMLHQTSGLSTDFLDGTNTFHDLTSAPAITLMRLRSFNAVGNPTFEVDQRTVSTVITSNNPICDRWFFYNTSGANSSCQKITTAATFINLPGTNFMITDSVLRFTVTAQKTVLAAGDICQIYQTIEGSSFRELHSDVHSISVLARSSVANVTFGLFIGDNSARTLTKLCTTGAANTPVLIALPNLPIWDAGGNFGIVPGAQGYILGISLACGTTATSPANDVWQTGSFNGAAGQGNFLANPVNSTLDLCFIQHEPGAKATTLIDCPFSGPNGNLEACQRYYQKTYNYGSIAGTASGAGQVGGFIAFNIAGANGPGIFKRTMAKPPTVTPYSSQGTINNINLNSSGASIAVTGTAAIGDAGFTQVLASGNTLVGGSAYNLHYTADTGW
jgi:hypothetical protein